MKFNLERKEKKIDLTCFKILSHLPQEENVMRALGQSRGENQTSSRQVECGDHFLPFLLTLSARDGEMCGNYAAAER